MARPPVDRQRERKFLLALGKGMPVRQACLEAKVGYTWGLARARGFRTQYDLEQSWKTDRIDAVRAPGDWSPEAKKAAEDIVYFARRYFGLALAPWQEEVAHTVVAKLATPEREYVVLNVAPGSGKSAFFTRVLPAWLTARNRRIRGSIGAAVMPRATEATDALRHEFMRAVPYQPSSAEVEAGLAFDAEATLSADFGRFQPDASHIWRRDAFVVAQRGGGSTSEKEPTWTAYGQDTTFLGMRLNIAIWDDAQGKDMPNADARAKFFRWWDLVAETRLEPGGLLLLQGQRIGAGDIYDHALSKRKATPEGEEADEGQGGRIYHHIVYKAHYDELCKGKHPSEPYPRGCLLFPTRLDYPFLMNVRRNDPDFYEVSYQQREVAPNRQLVKPVWVTGGTDKDTGTDHIGCWDNDRGLCEWPRGLAAPLYSIATVDPSPTKMWAFQWWLYHPASEQRFLLDLVRRRMGAPDMLDWDYGTQKFSGLAEEWQVRSRVLGAPIGWWIIEANAAQRFLFQFDHFRRWRQLHGISAIAHQTNVNKGDPKLGVPSIGPHWRDGRVRLPGEGDGRLASLKLIEEVTRWPDGDTDDQVMAEWFLEWNLPRLTVAEATVTTQRRPTWAPAFGKVPA